MKYRLDFLFCQFKPSRLQYITWVILFWQDQRINDEGNWKWDFTLGPILSREIRLAIAVVVKLSNTYYTLYSTVVTKYFSLFWLEFLVQKMYFIFKCDCLSGSNYIGNCTLEIAFSVNLQKAQFQNILSLRPNHCGPSRDPQSSNFFLYFKFNSNLVGISFSVNFEDEGLQYS